MYIFIYKEISFKESVHMIIQNGKSQICRVGWQGGNPGELMLHQLDKPMLTKPKGPLLAEFQEQGS